ncbi:MAG TPA: DUF1707 domain-containing protein [Propionibacteriaceae bacterium]|nr:DUF1707 domain-containing protein [Propionibacteriaceae bacterium]
MTEQWPMYPHPPQQPTGFSADPQSHPELRASNADRSRAVTLLDEAHADGRLSDTEFETRRDAATAAVTLGDIQPLIADVHLPTVAEPDSAALPVPYDPDPRPYDTATSSTDLATPEEKKRKHERLLFGFLPLWWVQLAVLFVGIWLLSSIGAGELQYFWPIWPLTGTGIYVISMSFDRAERRKHRERGDDQTS